MHLSATEEKQHLMLSRRRAMTLLAIALGATVTRPAFAANPGGLDLPVFTVKPFTLRPVSGLTGMEAPNLETLMGHVSVINFWGSWCPACRNEHAMLLKLRDNGLRMIGINVRDTDEKAVKYLAEAGNPFQFVGVDTTDGVLVEMLGVESYPQTFVVGPKAEVLWQTNSVLDEPTIEDVMKAVEGAKATVK